jgi:hypothetical protein
VPGSSTQSASHVTDAGNTSVGANVLLLAAIAAIALAVAVAGVKVKHAAAQR